MSNFHSEIKSYPAFVEAIEFIFETKIDNVKVTSYSFDQEDLPIGMKLGSPVVTYIDLHILASFRHYSCHDWGLMLDDSLCRRVRLSVWSDKLEAEIRTPYCAYMLTHGLYRPSDLYLKEGKTSKMPYILYTAARYILSTGEPWMIEHLLDVTAVPLKEWFDMCDKDGLIEAKAVLLRLNHERNKPEKEYFRL